jgi:pimeloyl-ACP methyl ester carboxylesterase
MKLILALFSFLLMHQANAQTTFDSKFPITSGYYSSFDGTKIYYEVRGQGNPVVLVHGFIVSGNSWKGSALYKALITGGYKVIILDMRGNGKSGKPHNEEAYERDAEARDIMGLTNYLSIKKYSVIGYSRGSIITARLLLLDKHIEDAVIGGMGTQFTNPEWPRRLMFYHALIADTVRELKSLVAYVQHQHLDQLALAYLQKYQPSASVKQLHSIKQPVLVIRGDKDEYNVSAPELAKILSNSTYETTPGDHDHAYITPEFAKEVITFLREHHY